MAFKLTTYDALNIKYDILIATKNYRSKKGITCRAIYNDKAFSICKGDNQIEIVDCYDNIYDYNSLFKAIFKYYKEKFNQDASSKTFLIPVEAFSANSRTFKSLYYGIYDNMSIFSKRSSVKVIFAIKPYLSFDNNSWKEPILKVNLNKYNLPNSDYTEYDLSNDMTPSLILNHIYDRLNEDSAIKSSLRCLLSVEDILNEITYSGNRKCFAHIISPDQFKKMRKNIKGRPRKRFTKESLYRMALVLGLSLENLLQILNIEGYSLSPNDSLDICMLNYYMKNEEISEPGFISFLRLNKALELSEDIINRLEEINNLNVKKRLENVWD